MKNLFVFLIMNILATTFALAENPPTQYLQVTVIESNIVGEDIIVHFSTNGNDPGNINLFPNQLIKFSSGMENIDVILIVKTADIVGEDIIVHFTSPSTPLNGLDIKYNQSLGYN